MLIENSNHNEYFKYKVVILTLDSHACGPCKRASVDLKKDFPSLEIEIHAAAEWSEKPDNLIKAKESVLDADIIIINLLFLEEHVNAILPTLKEKRENCDAMIGVISDASIVKLTKMGNLDMSAPQSGAMKILKKLRGSSKPSSENGQKRMKMLRSLPKILKYIPGKSQDLRAWFLVMQYWLGGSDDNINSLIRFLLSKYCKIESWKGGKVSAPLEYPEVGLYHPKLIKKITINYSNLPKNKFKKFTIGLILMRSYVLSSDTKHYDYVIKELESLGVEVIPVFSGGLDARPAIEKYFFDKENCIIDALISLTGFSLVGGPAYNDSKSAVEILKRLNVPYLSAHPLEFQTISQWSRSQIGLGPIETTMLVALPEIDGATNPTVFAGREDKNENKSFKVDGNKYNLKEMLPCSSRVKLLAKRSIKLANLRKTSNSEKKVAIIIFGFPPNSGSIGTAAYINVFKSLFNTLVAMKKDGYSVELPENHEQLRDIIIEGNSKAYGQEANVQDFVDADKILNQTPWLEEIENQWGPAPGKIQANGKSVFILGKKIGNIFIGVQPTFGYEGDPMRLLFERNFCPSHAFVSFYQWIKYTFNADAVLHFGMHGALEFMPGKQVGLNEDDWPDRLIGDLPNFYLYASNNPSEASLAKRRTNATIISHLTPPLATSGLYKGLLSLKESVSSFREQNQHDKESLLELIKEQSKALDLDTDDPEKLWIKLIELENALIPDGLHVIGDPLSEKSHQEYLKMIPKGDKDLINKISLLLRKENEIKGIIDALSGKYISPVPGGDLIRSTEILPTGRNMHAFDPFRMPTEFACIEGMKQANVLLESQEKFPKTIALVLWGSDNIKSDGIPISQALALIGAKPRFDSFGRLSGADLIPLEILGRPRVDVIMTLSGIFRDLLPLQTRLLAEASLKAAMADEPLEKNFIRNNSLKYSKIMNVDLETAALRVFSNAEGTYGSNVNQLVDSSAFDNEDELADAYEKRKSFAYGVSGKITQNPKLLQKALSDVDCAYQNLESVELGVTSVDHYFDTLGGISRAVKRAKGESINVLIADSTMGGNAKIRSLADQVNLETRSRSLNPKFYESLLDHGSEGVRQLEAHLTNTVGWSATTGQVQPWIYQKLSETFVLDDEMRRRMGEMNPTASLRMANRLLEAHERDYWQPDEATLEALRRGADELEDKCEGIAFAAE